MQHPAGVGRVGLAGTLGLSAHAAGLLESGHLDADRVHAAVKSYSDVNCVHPALEHELEASDFFTGPRLVLSHIGSHIPFTSEVLTLEVHPRAKRPPVREASVG